MKAALADVLVLDCTDELGAYGPRLLAALGADVVRVEDVRRRFPLPTAYDASLNACKTVVRIDPKRAQDQHWLKHLVASADLVFETMNPSLLRDAGLDDDAVAALNASAVHARIAVIGVEGPGANLPASDLTLMARGGLMWLAGEPDQAPVRAAGHQSTVATGIYAAIGSLIALHEAEVSGVGQRIDVAGLEVIATTLENAVQYWDLERTVRKRAGSRPREAGSGLFKCRDGFVYMMAGRLTTPRGWISIVEWLNEAGIPGAKELEDLKWRDYAFRTQPAPTAYFTELFSRFAAGRAKVDLYEEGQRRGIVICPVNRPADLLSDRQLTHRHFFVPQCVEGREILVPRGPFVMSGTPLRRPSAPQQRPPAEVTWSKRPKRATNVAARRSELPLTGIRVADFTWVGAGPFATKVLADHGAEVIKIESATRPDALRNSPPFQGGEPGPNRSGYFANRNTSKKSVTLNMKDPRGVELARELIASSDIVANSFTPGTMEKWGLGYEDCRGLRADVIYLSMPMHGGDGPHGQFLGYGAAISALSGLYAATGYPDCDPVGTGTNYPDHVPNPGHAVVALLAALRHRRRTGEGQCIELSQVESTICALGPLVIEAQLDSADGLLRGNREPQVAPHGVYRTAGDDRWIAIACWSEREWSALCAVAQCGWERDARFATLPARLVQQDALDAAVSAWTKDDDAFELSARLQFAGIDAAPVQHAQDLLERDEQLRHAGHWVSLEHAEMGRSIYDAPPFRLSATPGRLRSPAPLLGEHTDEIIGGLLGLPDDEIEKLRAEKVLA